MYQKNNAIGIVAIATFLLVAFAEAGSDECRNLKNLDYKFHGTKTIYEVARKHLNDKDDRPSSFGDDSLEEEHEKLTKDSCKPVVFYFVGRHSARFPDGEEIDQYNKDLKQLQENLKSQDAYRRCPEKFKEFIEWIPKMRFEHDNLITHLGATEEINIAKRFKKLYPEFFDANKTDFEIGVTPKLRTAQTGMEFLREAEHLKSSNCHFDKLPTHDLNSKDYSLDKILKDECYKYLNENKAKPFLDFNKNCDKIGGKPKMRDPLIERVKNPQILDGISKRVAKKLGLPKRARSLVSRNILDSIYNMCIFENAMKNDSVWCRLLEKEDIEVFEYIEDVNSYIKSAYGPRSNTRQACPLVKDLVETLHDATKQSGEEKYKRRAHFYFYHAAPMKKLLAAFGLFRDDENFTESKISEFEKNLKVPKDREWRLSLVTPFSANMAFIMYRCEKPNKPIKYKILSTVTERPVRLGGCKDTRCNSEKFFAAYDSMRDCDLTEICAPA